jgi:putative transposase
MKAYKTEIKLNKEQEAKYKLNTSACRFVWNLFISINKSRYEKGEKYLNNYDFSKWFNNEYIPNNKGKEWLKQGSSKAIRNTIDNCNKSYKLAFKNKRGFPKFKKASKDKTGYYFVRNSKLHLIRVFRHKINIPCIGWVTIKEKNYIPKEGIISGSIIKRANKYFLSVIVDEDSKKDNRNVNEGLGIDLGIKTFMYCSDGDSFLNINKTKRVKKLEKSLRRQQRALSRKLENNKKLENKNYRNIDKNKLKINKLYFKLENIRNAYINQCVDKVIKKKPKFITLEDLNVKGMIKNRCLSKHIKDSKFYYTKQVIIQKATKHNIEVREVDRFYPSSKICSCCSNVNKNLKLSDRIYRCDCGLEIDRDLNASINLRDAKVFKKLNNTDGLSGINDCGVSHKTKLVTSSNEIEHGETVKSKFIKTIQAVSDYT